ncbi:MAG: hypothetical protein KJN92_12825 [Gemmatimonadetes bacterium]|nr:hypothetical protein [Gemmatimonadota bacterium]
MPHLAALPFNLRRSSDVLGAAEMTTTTEKVHGLLRLEGDRLIIQWRLTRKIETLGSEIRTDEEMEPVQEVVLPLRVVAGAKIRRPWWLFGRGLRLALTAADLQAFDAVAGEGGLKLSHPAELVLRLRRQDALAAEEFTAELALAKAEISLGGSRERLRDPS